MAILYRRPSGWQMAAFLVYILPTSLKCCFFVQVVRNVVNAFKTNIVWYVFVTQLLTQAPTFNNEYKHVEAPRIEAPTWGVGMEWDHGRAVYFSSRPGIWVDSPMQLDPGRPATRAFCWICSCKNVSDSSNFHHFCVGKKCWNCSHGKILTAGAKWYYCPSVPRVSGRFPRCLFGVGAYDCWVGCCCR